MSCHAAAVSSSVKASTLCVSSCAALRSASSALTSPKNSCCGGCSASPAVTSGPSTCHRIGSDPADRSEEGFADIQREGGDEDDVADLRRGWPPGTPEHLHRNGRPRRHRPRSPRSLLRRRLRPSAWACRPCPRDALSEGRSSAPPIPTRSAAAGPEPSTSFRARLRGRAAGWGEEYPFEVLSRSDDALPSRLDSVRAGGAGAQLIGGRTSFDARLSADCSSSAQPVGKAGSSASAFSHWIVAPVTQAGAASVPR